MSQYTVINSSYEQVDKLYRKHLSPFINRFFKHIVPRIVRSKYSYDHEDNIGFVTLYTVTGKTIEYQLRSMRKSYKDPWIEDTPCFVGCSGFGNIRYDIGNDLESVHPELFKLLKDEGIKAKNRFWKGGDI